MKKITLGIVAHVDAGKTTLAEAILYTCNKIRKLGRVDHKDCVLDHYAIERERGITVFSKQANVTYNDTELILLDTPGHVDFGAETERTLSVLDAAILVISAKDRVQAHTLTLFSLLKRYHVPTFIFVNKMDQDGNNPQEILSELHTRLSDSILDFSNTDELDDALSMCNEEMMEAYLENGVIAPEQIAKAVQNSEVIPCLFGSALHLDGVSELLDTLTTYLPNREYSNALSGRVYKISRDEKSRLTHCKLTGGTLKVKDIIKYRLGDTEHSEKIDQIRVYDGSSYTLKDSMEAGDVCVLTGLEHTYCGMGIGSTAASEEALLTPVLTYRVILPEGTDSHQAYSQFKMLYEELPEINISWDDKNKQIHVQVMGDVQIEILKRLVSDRFHLDVGFSDGAIVYKETILTPAVGIGHYEPLRHYAEVHLLLEPLPAGSGLELACSVSTDDLDLNWQRLIMTHLKEKSHIGVLGGFPITDLRITVIAGRAHLKHTEGGDFRQSTYRAIRQGLMQCASQLLEPFYAFELEIPTSEVGRAMTDIRKMEGSIDTTDSGTEISILKGSAPVATMRNYRREVNSYTHGLGRLNLRLKGYYPCHNASEVLEAIGYEPDADLDNPSASVFCSHGAGVLIPWYEVADYAHIECDFSLDNYIPESSDSDMSVDSAQIARAKASSGTSTLISQEEIERIYANTYKQSGEDLLPYRDKNPNGVKITTRNGPKQKPYVYKPIPKKEEYLLVDGYNVIFADPKLNALSKVNIDSARDALTDLCVNYQGSTGCTLILVYDAYKVKGNPGSVTKYQNIYLVYTKEAETADMYIEKTVHKIARNANVTVATSDALEQMIIWGDGAKRISAKGFMAEMENQSKLMREQYLS